MQDLLLKHVNPDKLPDAPEGYSRVMVGLDGALVVADQDRKETHYAAVKTNQLTGGAEFIASNRKRIDVKMGSAEPSGAIYSGIGTQTLFDLGLVTASSGAASFINNGTAACPDPTFPFNIFQIGASATIDQALGTAVPITGIDAIGFWARAVRTSDAAGFTSCKILISESVSGFTTFGELPFAIRADGRWRYYTVPLVGLFTAGVTITTIGRVRIREADGVAGDGRPLMGAGDFAQFGAFRINPRGSSAMFVRLDDGLDNLVSNKTALLASQFTGLSGVTIPQGSYSVMELLDYFGFKGNAFVLTDFVGKKGFATWADLRYLQDQKGWSICVQAAANPVSNSGDGARLFGPLGFNLHATPGDVASVSGSVFTLAGSRPDSIGGTTGSVLGVGGVQPFPVIVNGTPPAPLVAGQTYYALRRGVRQFSLHTVPVGASPADDSQGLVTITGSDTSQMTLRYAGSSNDETAIANDYRKAQEALAANGLTGVNHLALNQGGFDVHVEKAIVQRGFKSCQTTARHSSFIPTFGGFVALTRAHVALTPATNGITGTTASGVFSTITIIQSDGLPTAAQMRQFVANCAKFGSVGANYHHGTNASNTLVLLAYLDQLKMCEDVGLVDVLTVEEYQERLNVFSKSLTL